MSAPLPSTIQVGPHRYEVRVQRGRIDAREDNGLVILSDCQIDLSPYLASSKQRTVLLHEVLHAVFHLSGDWRSTEKEPITEDQVCGLLADHLLMVLQENPDLVAYLTAPEDV